MTAIPDPIAVALLVADALDIPRIVHVQADRLDRVYLERTASLIGVDDLLRRALGEREVR